MDQLFVDGCDRREHTSERDAFLTGDEVVGAEPDASVVLADLVALAVEVVLSYALSLVEALQDPGCAFVRRQGHVDRGLPFFARHVVGDLHPTRAPRELRETRRLDNVGALALR